MSELEKKLSSQILGLQSQLKKEEDLHKDSKNEAKDIHARLYQQIFGLNKRVSELENSLEAANEHATNLKGTISEL